MKTRNLNLIMLLAGLLIFAVLLLAVKNPYETKAAELVSENNSLQPQLETLEEHYSNVDAYELNIIEAGEYIDDTITYYPGAITEEEFLVWILDWEDRIGHDVSMVNLTSGYGLYTFPCYVGYEDTLVDITASVIKTDLEATISYTAFKDSLDYIYDDYYVTSLDSVSLAYNTETGLLSTSYALSKYYLAYEGAPYDPDSMPTVNKGVSNLFRAE
ncbi:MAG: hypothetical protein R3Y47_07940 [Lachnospiraceae bacterium]